MAYLGLIKRKECWVPTIRGWLILAIGVSAVLILTTISIYPFLAVSHPVQGSILVVEGWLPVDALEQAIDEFRSKNYQSLVTVGVPIPSPISRYRNLAPVSRYRNLAERGADILKRLGFDEDLIVAVPAPNVEKDRTYASAVALKNWLLNSGQSVKAINVYSLGPHARRSRLLFEKVLGDNIAVGVIAADNLDYDARSWWTSSSGVRTVIGEMIAYFYARCFFISGSKAA